MTSPRWLTPAEQRAWRAFFESHKILTVALDRQLQRDGDLRNAYYEVLVRLSETPGRTLRMSELAEYTHSSRSRLSHAVARLEERGWVSRSPDESDGRGHNATLTDEGFAVLQAAAPGHVDAVRDLVIDALTPEQLAVMAVIGETIIERVRVADSRQTENHT